MTWTLKTYQNLLKKKLINTMKFIQTYNTKKEKILFL